MMIERTARARRRDRIADEEHGDPRVVAAAARLVADADFP